MGYQVLAFRSFYSYFLHYTQVPSNVLNSKGNIDKNLSCSRLSSHLCSELKSLTEKLVILLGSRNEPEVEILVSNLRVESENAIAYIKQAFSLLVPVLQLGAT